MSGSDLLRLQRKMEEESLFTFAGILFLEPLFTGANELEFLKNPPKTDILLGTTAHEQDDVDPSAEDNLIVDFLYKNVPEVMNKYWKEERKGNLPFNNSITTQNFFIGTKLCAKQMAATGANVYLYSYDYPNHSFHTDDLYFIMGVHPFEMDENERILKEIYLDYFLNFARTGNPSDNWTTFHPKNNNYLSVNVNLETGVKPHMENNYHQEVMKYWGRDMILYDELVTLRKKSGLRVNGYKQLFPVPTVSQPSENAQEFYEHGSEFASYAAAFFCIVVFFLMGFVLGRFTKPTYKSRSSEKLPLLYEMY